MQRWLRSRESGVKVSMETAVERWEAILNARAQQMDAAYARLGRTSADFWDRRARRFHSTTKDAVAHDPLFHRLQSVVTTQMSVLTAGQITGVSAAQLGSLLTTQLQNLSTTDIAALSSALAAGPACHCR